MSNRARAGAVAPIPLITRHSWSETWTDIHIADDAERAATRAAMFAHPALGLFDRETGETGGRHAMRTVRAQNGPRSWMRRQSPARDISVQYQRGRRWRRGGCGRISGVPPVVRSLLAG